MKIDETHISIFAVDDASTDTLSLHKPVFESVRVDQPPTLKEVLVAKVAWAAKSLEWATSYIIQESDFA